MNKTKYLVLLVIVVIAGLSSIFVHENQDVFDGSRVKNPDCYILQFERMNQIDSQEMVLDKGDSLSVDFKVDSGNFKMTVGIADKEPLFTGGGIKEDSFVLTAPEAGNYTITIDAENAAGYIMIYAHKNKK